MSRVIAFIEGQEPIVKMKEICTPDVAWCGRETSALEAARLMRHKHVGDLVVVDDPDGARTPIGVVTDRDLVIEIMAKGVDPSTVTVAELVRTPVVIADETEDVGPVIERMRTHGVRRIPIVDRRGAVAGIVTLDDLLKCVVDEAAKLVGIVAKGRDREQRVRR
jgi:CBS domain-containing protein